MADADLGARHQLLDEAVAEFTSPSVFSSGPSGAVCLCEGVTLSPRQWLLIRTLLSVCDREIHTRDASYTNGPVRRDVDPTPEEYADLCAKLAATREMNVYCCPVHPGALLPILRQP